MAAGEPAIEVCDLSRSYRTTTGFLRRQARLVEAVRGINFTVNQGEVFGLLGPNGAGKTTTIKILATMLLPTGGTARVLGRDVAREAEVLRPRINVIFGGERSLYWRLTARQNLQYFCDLYRVPAEQAARRIPELLELVGLTDAADRRVETYSKGMKQRLQIARGLVNRPEVLFLDEPTIGLDPVAAYELRRLIAALAQQGTTIILTTHYMFEAEQLCDRIAIIDRGRIIALESPAALKRLAVGLSVVEAEVANVTEPELQALAAIDGAQRMTRSALGQRLVLQVPTEQPEAVAEGMRRLLRPDQLLLLKSREANLEDAYIRLVGGSGK
ncbi:MAG: ABC transporter ATP-binding protein [Bacillota bacterium]